jgi:hypothetical protein
LVIAYSGSRRPVAVSLEEYVEADHDLVPAAVALRFILTA